MARISGVDLPKNKRGIVGLTYIYGIGSSRAKEILTKAEIDEHTKVNDWTDDSIRKITTIIQDEYTVEGELRSEVQLNIKRLIDQVASLQSNSGGDRLMTDEKPPHY